jgi:thiamine biosynthesis lipoprotein
MRKILIFAMLLTLVLTGCSGAVASDGENTVSGKEETETKAEAEAEIPVTTRDIFAMDTYMTLTGYGERSEEAIEAAVQEIERLDEMLSVGNEESEISIINQNGSGTISEDTAIMLEEAISLYETTEGAFDITVYPLMEAWGFTTQNFRVPEEDELNTLLNAVDASAITYDSETGLVTLGENQGIDFGGIAKGYASSRIMEIFEEYGLVSGMVSLGGNVQCYSTKTDGTPWKCGIVNPEDAENTSDLMGIVSIVDKAVITSGGYERFFEDEETGEVYHHILNPSTGYPANSGLTSVTIVSSNGMLADGLSTSIYIMGLEKASDYWRQYGDAFDMVLMTEDGTVYITEGLKDSFTTEFPLSVITK